MEGKVTKSIKQTPGKQLEFDVTKGWGTCSLVEHKDENSRLGTNDNGDDNDKTHIYGVVISCQAWFYEDIH